MTISLKGDMEASCKQFIVRHADWAKCSGEYVLSNYRVPWADNKPVFKHVSMNR